MLLFRILIDVAFVALGIYLFRELIIPLWNGGGKKRNRRDVL